MSKHYHYKIGEKKWENRKTKIKKGSTEIVLKTRIE